MAYDLVQEAIETAQRAHQRDTRIGSGKPYIIHPDNVGKMVLTLGAPKEVVAAAWLHDVAEDHPEIDLKHFPQDVLDLVEAVTHRNGTKTDAIQKLRGNKWALLIKLADRYDNLSDPSPYREKYLRKPIVQESTKLLLEYSLEVGWASLPEWDFLNKLMNP